MHDLIFKNTGYCAICEAEACFVAHNEWLRDYYVCTKCGSIPRQRALVTVLKYICPDYCSKAVHESSPVMSYFEKKCDNYSFSHYLEDVPLGSCRNGIRSENLEAMTFDDNHFDIFITQDVLEHVMNPKAAFREIMRVLAADGVHIFTIPQKKDLERSFARATCIDSEVHYIKEPDYHINPIGDGRSLVTWDYGRDFEELVSAWSGYQVSTYTIRDRSLGIDGEHLEVFSIKKNRNNAV